MKRQNYGHRWTDAEIKKLIGLWMREVDTADIAKELNSTISAVNKLAQRLRREGVPLKRKIHGHKAGRNNKPWTQEEVEYLVRRRNDQINAETIGTELGRSFQAVQNMIQKLRSADVPVKMLGCGVRRLWSPDRLKMAVAGRGLGGDA